MSSLVFVSNIQIEDTFKQQINNKTCAGAVMVPPVTASMSRSSWLAVLFVVACWYCCGSLFGDRSRGATPREDAHDAVPISRENINSGINRRQLKNTPSPPMPTKSQQKYADNEIMALIHFNMGTYAGNGDPSCNRDNWLHGTHGRMGSGNPAFFDPYLLDTDQWARVFSRLGAKHAVLTAKHGCGFLLWPSEVPIVVTRDDATTMSLSYTYGVGRNESAIHYDVLDRFVKSMRSANLGVGFYYSLKNNFYLNRKDHKLQYNTSQLLPGQIQHDITQTQYETMALGHLRELWTRYGPLMEHWFDGGYTPTIQAKLRDLIAELQPDMMVWHGQNITENTIAWVGTESGFPTGDDIWSAGCELDAHTGHPDDDSGWCPKGCDTTLQENDVWFYDPQGTIRSLETMVQIYHKTVGRNGVLELDVAVDKTGRIRHDHAQRYAELGDYIRDCYGSPLRQWNDQQGYVLDFDVLVPVLIDRIVLREDQLQGGQRVRHYKVYVQLKAENENEKNDDSSTDEWTFFSEGHSIGNKRIDVLGRNTTKTAMQIIKLRVHVIAASDLPLFREIALFSPCSDPKAFGATVSAVK